MGQQNNEWLVRYDVCSNYGVDFSPKAGSSEAGQDSDWW